MKIKQGQTLWEKAKKIIPGGNQLLSKRSERFLPGLWPAYYSKAKGCEVWDLDGKHYFDFASMGVGSCILGYADDDVNEAVIHAIQQGSMSTLNSYEEVELAEKLIKLHPWAEMARFTRTGGEACAVAVRIGRAATGRNKVAFCGYHGWHDWYIAANLGNATNLDEQLLPGLKPAGVPQELEGTLFPFHYNCFNELEAIISEHGKDIGVIMMEPERGVPSQNNFLENVRKIATRIGAVLIFDEVTSGFRANVGGIHLTLGVEPDIAVFGKALGNGFPISAVVGRQDVMDCAQDSFISSTFWTERVGYVAALATIQKMETHQVPQHLEHCGKRLRAGWKRLAETHGIPIKIFGIPAMNHLTFEAEEPLVVKTFYAQELLEKGYLYDSSIFSTYAYSDPIIDRFLEDSAPIFAKVKEAWEGNQIRKLLKYGVADPKFKRLTETV